MPKAKEAAPRGWSVQQNKDEPGRYDYIAADDYEHQHSGFIKLPYPFMLNHLNKWWSIGVDPLKELEPIQWKHWDIEWQGAKMLIVDFGTWAIEGISEGDVKDDNLPAVLEEWAIACVKDYVLPQLDPKKRLVLLTVL